MKLATLKQGGRDGTLVVTSRDLAKAVPVSDVARTLQAALDDWTSAAPRLNRVYELLNASHAQTINGEEVFAVDPAALAAPLPRAYEFVDGSAYLPHVERVRRARGAQVPESFYSDPLMYQAVSAGFYGPRDPVRVTSEEYGIDLEAEVVVVTDDVPMATTPAEAAAHIQLIGLINDVSLRNLIPNELAKGFGFYQSKPATAFSPVAITPDELGTAWRDSKVHLPLVSRINGQDFGRPDAGTDMTFSFAQLIAHAGRTRRLGAGAIVGSGTVSNYDRSRGSSCLAEKRTLEQLEHGAARTPFLQFGDRVAIEMFDAEGRSIFGSLDNQVVRAGG